ncbi:MAG TPA: redox-sensing transcriptional repressor Rex [Acidimicrobiales bacterium]|nr:redox-sensing transcriptional repressor Rex [Acidimicrobiales bacterium]
MSDDAPPADRSAEGVRADWRWHLTQAAAAPLPEHVEEGDDAADAYHRGDRRVPEATVARLPVYLRCLVELADAKVVTISSERLAEMAGVNAAKVRKDLSYLGSYGTRGVGYDVEYLLLQVSRVLGLTQDWPVVIVGIGNLGHALANYKGFAARGFRIAALVDADPAKVGEKVGGMAIRHLDELPEIVAEHQVAIGIIATPASVAQDVADRLVASGVSSILNFAPVVLAVPPEVSLRKVDLSIELQILSFYQQRRGGGTPLDELPADATGQVAF